LISTLALGQEKLKIALVGARLDGQAGVILDVLSYYKNIEVVAFFDNTSKKKNNVIRNIPVVGDIHEITKFKDTKIDAIHVSIGDNKARYDIYKELELTGIPFLSIIHPTSIISSSAKIGAGCFIGANAVVQNNSIVGNYSMINTGAIIEHDNILGEATHIAPNACTGGRVKVHDLAFIGIGSVVVPDVSIGKSAFVNAGTLVKKSVSNGLTMIGYSSKIHKKNIYLDLDK